MKPARQQKPLNVERNRYSGQAGDSSGHSSDGSSADKTTAQSNTKERRHSKSSNCSSSTTESKRHCKQATFCNKVKGYAIMSHRNFSREEHRNTWVADEDEKASQAHVIKSVRAIRKRVRHGQPIPSCLSDTDELCVRGLEKMHTSQSRQLSENRKVAVRYAVLEEQHRQRQRNKPDTKRIARASLAHSSESADLAIAQAAKDAAYVNLHVRERPSARRSMEHIPQQSRSRVEMNEVQISLQSVNISGSVEEEQSNRSLLSSPTNPNQPTRRRESSLTTLEQSGRSLLSSPTNPNQPRRRDSSLTTLEQSDPSLPNSPTNPNQPRRRDSSLTTLGEQAGNESARVVISGSSHLISLSDQSHRSVDSSAVATDSASTLNSRRSIESRTLIRQGRGLYQPRNDPNERNPRI